MKKTSFMSPSQCLRILRVNEELTTEELGKQLGIKESLIFEMEKGEVPISLKVAKSIEAVYGLSHRIFI